MLLIISNLSKRSKSFSQRTLNFNFVKTVVVNRPKFPVALPVFGGCLTGQFS